LGICLQTLCGCAQ